MKTAKKEPLEEEFDYYIANQSKLVKKYKPGSFLIQSPTPKCKA